MPAPSSTLGKCPRPSRSCSVGPGVHTLAWAGSPLSLQGVLGGPCLRRPKSCGSRRRHFIPSSSSKKTTKTTSSSQEGTPDVKASLRGGREQQLLSQDAADVPVPESSTEEESEPTQEAAFKRFHCDHCSQRFPNKRALGLHRRYFHDESGKVRRKPGDGLSFFCAGGTLADDRESGLDTDGDIQSGVADESLLLECRPEARDASEQGHAWQEQADTLGDGVDTVTDASATFGDGTDMSATVGESTVTASWEGIDILEQGAAAEVVSDTATDVAHSESGSRRGSQGDLFFVYAPATTKLTAGHKVRRATIGGAPSSLKSAAASSSGTGHGNRSSKRHSDAMSSTFVGCAGLFSSPRGNWQHPEEGAVSSSSSEQSPSSSQQDSGLVEATAPGDGSSSRRLSQGEIFLGSNFLHAPAVLAASARNSAERASSSSMPQGDRTWDWDVETSFRDLLQGAGLSGTQWFESLWSETEPDAAEQSS